MILITNLIIFDILEIMTIDKSVTPSLFDILSFLRKSRSSQFRLPLFRCRESILFYDSHSARARDRSTGARFSAKRCAPLCSAEKNTIERKGVKRGREKSMKKRKMLIGAACSVQQRVLTRLPGTLGVPSLSCLGRFSALATNTFQQTLPARYRLSSKREGSLWN